MRGLYRVLLPFVLIVGAVPAMAQIGVSPPKLELSLADGPTTESIRVFNFGAESTRVRVAVYSWDLDEANRVRILEPTEQSLDQWIAINPLSFEVPAGKSQVVRFSVRPRVEPQPGEHRAIIYLEEVPREAVEASQVQVLYRMGVAVYAYAGEVERNGALNAVRVEGTSIEVDVSSLGNAHVRFDGQYSVWPADAYPGALKTGRVADPERAPDQLPEDLLLAGALPKTPVLGGTRRNFVLDLERQLPPGDYVLDLNGTFAGATIDQGIPFSILSDETFAAMGTGSGHE